ncbi:WD40 repeat protein [Ceraceosorus bombacis]|uniref:WD40 repeat protein n=1 Tax=Ceraceosorus bombacis TaxID=401625 RepID=A0A0P1BIM2_9BASI|nr:WD40 repeat protein [Ceraceosorus bombacis]
MTLNPFSHLPDSVDRVFSSACSVLSFSPSGLSKGHYLAVGRTDGFVVIYDLETRCAVRILEGHVKAVTALAWSGKERVRAMGGKGTAAAGGGRMLASASLDGMCLVWDLSMLSSTTVEQQQRQDHAHTHISSHSLPPCGAYARYRVRLDAPLIGVEFQYGDTNTLLLTLETQQAVIVDLGVRQRGLDRHADSRCTWQAEEVMEKRIALESHFDASDGGIASAAFHPSGEYLLAGTTRGLLLFFALRTLNVDEYSERLANVLANEDAPIREVPARMDVELVSRVNVGGGAVRQMRWGKSGRNVVLNSNDRSIRVFALTFNSVDGASNGHPVANGAATPNGEPAPEQLAHSPSHSHTRTLPQLTPTHRFQDLVNRTPWSGIGFSADGEYIFAGAAHVQAHNIYIWDRGLGALEKVLEGPRDSLMDVDWHPTRPLLASASAGAGSVNLWFTPGAEIWSAYAPGFEELEENVEYEEREDEFDVEDELAATRRKLDEEEVLVDILGSAHDLRAPVQPRVVHSTGFGQVSSGADSIEKVIYVAPDPDDDPNFVLPVDLAADLDSMLAEDDDD